MDPITGALILGGVSLFGNYFGSQQAQNMNELLMDQQFEYSKQLMQYQHDINSPKHYMNDLQQAGISPAVMLSKGMNQQQTSLGSTPQSDLQGATANKMFAAQMLNLGSQTALNYANAEKAKKEAEKAGVETEGLITDNEFRALLHQADLYLMDADTQQKLKQVELDDQTITNLKQEYEKLVKETDEIEANIELIKENANKMKEETALVKLQQELQKELAAASIRVSDAQCYLFAKEAYAAAIAGDMSAVEAGIKKVQLKYEEQNQQNLALKNYYDKNAARHASNYKAAAAGIAANEKQISNAALEAEKGLAVAGVWCRTLGKVMTDAGNDAARVGASVAAAAGSW